MMCDDDSVMWPSPLPPCPVAASIVTAVQIAMAQQIDETWKQAAVEGFTYKELEWTPTKPTHHTDGQRTAICETVHQKAAKRCSENTQDQWPRRKDSLCQDG